MTDKTKTQSSSGTSSDEQNPEALARAFLELWQKKWTEMLQQKGWPADTPIPGMTNMPFMHPLMMGMGFGGFGAPPATPHSGTEQLQHRISELEKRIEQLERQLSSASTPRKPKRKTKPTA